MVGDSAVMDLLNLERNETETWWKLTNQQKNIFQVKKIISWHKHGIMHMTWKQTVNTKAEMIII